MIALLGALTNIIDRQATGFYAACSNTVFYI